HLAADMKEVKSNICFNAMHALAVLGRESKAARGALLAGLEHPFEELRIDAAAALGDLSRKDERIAGALIQVLKDKKSPRVYHEAAQALGHIDPKGVIPILLEDLKTPRAAAADRAQGIRTWAASALLSFGKEAQLAVPTLLQILQNKNLDHDLR